MDLSKEALQLHKKLRGKIEIQTKIPVKSLELLTLLYTPGVAEVSKEIFKNKELAYDYTSKWNTIAIITDGSRVLGLGNIGPEAALPVMEGKSILFKYFGNVDAFPICLATQETEKIVDVIKSITPAFGGINIEDIDAPRCFEVMEKLTKELDIPIFHDDQHGTGIVALAGLMNSLKVVGKKSKDVKIVIAGSGSAGYGITKIFLANGIENIILLDSKGIIYGGRKENMNKYKEELAKETNKEMLTGDLRSAIKDSDVFIGVSGIPNMLKGDMIKLMQDDAIIFALTNPTPEIFPDDAKKAGAKIVATGRSDFPNQLNNVLAFPGVFRGALDVRAREINEEMRISAAHALISFVKDPNENKILPEATDRDVSKAVARAVVNAAIKTKVNRKI
jgi:malate dehydrogenase (oxaloacetate-decarboxylating)